MPSLDVNGCPINYVVEGTGDPVMLIHGFASSLHGNWRAPGVIDAIVAAGRQVIAIDCRGHGRSGKPHDPQAYAGSAMADDAIAVLDHLRHRQGRSRRLFDGRFPLDRRLLVNHPQRWRSVIISGMGDVLLTGQSAVASSSTRSSPRWRRRTPRRSKTRAVVRSDSLRRASGNDLRALAAMHKTPRDRLRSRRSSPTVKIPVLVLIGDKDNPASAQATRAMRFRVRRSSKCPAIISAQSRRRSSASAIVDWLTR